MRYSPYCSESGILCQLQKISKNSPQIKLSTTIPPITYYTPFIMSAAEEDQDLVDYDEEEEEQNVAAEETADAEGKETKK